MRVYFACTSQLSSSANVHIFLFDELLIVLVSPPKVKLVYLDYLSVVYYQ